MARLQLSKLSPYLSPQPKLKPRSLLQGKAHSNPASARGLREVRTDQGDRDRPRHPRQSQHDAVRPAPEGYPQGGVPGHRDLYGSIRPAALEGAEGRPARRIYERQQADADHAIRRRLGPKGILLAGADRGP